ncbi:MAG: hypothetical protein ACLTKG_06040 [Collinsella intestinalis]
MEEDYGAFIEDRRAEILQRVDASLAVSGCTRDEVELVAVSKTVGLMQYSPPSMPDIVYLARTVLRSCIVSSRVSSSSRRRARALRHDRQLADEQDQRRARPRRAHPPIGTMHLPRP